MSLVPIEQAQIYLTLYLLYKENTIKAFIAVDLLYIWILIFTVGFTGLLF